MISPRSSPRPLRRVTTSVPPAPPLPPRRASPTHGSPTSSPRYEKLLIMKQILCWYSSWNKKHYSYTCCKSFCGGKSNWILFWSQVFHYIACHVCIFVRACMCVCDAQMWGMDFPSVQQGPRRYTSHWCTVCHHDSPVVFIESFKFLGCLLDSKLSL